MMAYFVSSFPGDVLLLAMLTGGKSFIDIKSVETDKLNLGVRPARSLIQVGKDFLSKVVCFSLRNLEMGWETWASTKCSE